ncbi:hypothetical protein [Methylobacterium indicum]|uniref:hypothetical protein n=1 Tax=Methylobacterium indicum TaxID=1775910 RepID=UPI000F782183|nr:hypothetical protein [Methylobacterium indicum]
MIDAHSAYRESMKEEDRRYEATLDALDPKRLGLMVTCPACQAVSWVKLPEKRYGLSPITISCPRSCGFYGPIFEFKPKDSRSEDATDFDIEYECPRDHTLTRSQGRVFKCPTCAIENPRDIMRDLRESVERDLAQNPDRDRLADLLSRTVGTFDGVMRACNVMAVRVGQSGSAGNLPPVNSFQNIAAARQKMSAVWDMKSVSHDWNALVRSFQKRHCFAHTLGVVDQSYIDKSGDITAVVGRQVSLTTEEVRACVLDTENIVRKFFGMFLS